MGGTQFKSNKTQQAVFLDHLKETGNISRSAKQAGVGRDTVYRLINNDTEFKENVDQSRLEYLQNMSSTMQKHAPEAVETLLAVMRDETSPKSAKVSASSKILEYAMSWSEALDYETQINNLTNELASAKERGII